MWIIKLRERLSRTPFRWRLGLLVCYVLLVAGASLLPSFVFPVVPKSLKNTDKVVHFVMYGGLAVLLRWAVAGFRNIGKVRFLLLICVVVYGFMLEILQALVTGGSRGFEGGDVAANTLGAFLLWLLAGRFFDSACRES